MTLFTVDLNLTCCVFLFQRVKKARQIYNAHLAANAPDPVNVDSESRKAAEAGLDNPTPELFNTPQLHVRILAK